MNNYRQLLLIFIFFTCEFRADVSFQERIQSIIHNNIKYNKKDLSTLKKHAEYHSKWPNLPFITYLFSHNDIAWLANNVVQTNELNTQLQKVLEKSQPIATKYLAYVLQQQQEQTTELKQSLDSHMQWNKWIFAISVGFWALIGGVVGAINIIPEDNERTVTINIPRLFTGAAVVGIVWGLPTHCMCRHKDVDWLPTNIKRNQEMINQLEALLNQPSTKNE